MRERAGKRRGIRQEEARHTTTRQARQRQYARLRWHRNDIVTLKLIISALRFAWLMDFLRFRFAMPLLPSLACRRHYATFYRLFRRHAAMLPLAIYAV